MAKSLVFVFGVPIAIAVGVIVGAVFEIVHVRHSAAWGLLIGVGSAASIGGVIGIRAARTNYKWVRRDLTPVSKTDWAAVVMALNVRAADEHYLLVRQEADYVAYAPTLVTPIAAGPMTVSGDYLSVVVARLNATTITIVGPQYMVDALETAAKEARAVQPDVS